MMNYSRKMMRYGSVIMLLFTIFTFLNVEAADGTRIQCDPSESSECDECFDGGYLYAGKMYRLYDTFSNNSSSKQRIMYRDNRGSLGFKNLQYGHTVFNHFENDIEWQEPGSFVWKVGGSGRYYHIFEPNTSTRFIETKDGKGLKLVNISANANRNNYALRVLYNINYQQREGTSGAPDPTIFNHKECIYYRPAWCGDGVLSIADGEACDPNDTTHVGWGNGGCDQTCRPITITQNPTCNSLTATPNSGNSPLSTNFTCAGTNANSYRIDILNSNGNVINTINSATGNYTFNTNGTYTARCNINGNITSPSCNTNIQVNTLTPTPTCNSLTATPNSGNSPLSTNFTCAGTNANSYRIDILNSNGNVINTINSATGNYTFNTNGTYTARCNINGNITSPSCNTNIQVNTLTPTPTCNSLTATPNSGNSPLTTSLTCAGTNANSYRIELLNSNGNVINTINNSTGNYTFTSTGAYTARCNINGNITSPSCNTNIQVNTPTNPSQNPTCGTAQMAFDYSATSWGTFTFCNAGGTPNPANPSFPSQGGNVSWTCTGVAGSTPANCSASRGVYSPGGGISNCIPGGSFIQNKQYTGNESEAEADWCSTGNMSGFTRVVNGTTETYTWECSGYSMKCTSFYTPSGPGPGGPSGTPSCGDGILQPGEKCDFGITAGQPGYIAGCRDKTNYPNNACTYCGDGILDDYSETGEECDFGGSSPWNNWKLWCNNPTFDENKRCKIVDRTDPAGGNIEITPSGSILLGHGMKVFENLSSNKITIKNKSTSDIYINDYLCVYNKHSAIIGNTYCSPLIGKLDNVNKTTNSTSFTIPLNSDFTANIPGNALWKSKNGEIVTTLSGFYYKNPNTFLRGLLNVTVAKPTISTVGGGASLLKGTNLSDVSVLSQQVGLNETKNKNLILTSLGTGALSSYSKKATDEITTKTKTDGKKDLEGYSKITSNLSKIRINDFPITKYNGLDNVFIHNGDVNLGAKTITGGKTYIIENGNLTINGDIKVSSGTILFVVKNGDIIINKDVNNKFVKQIDAVLIAIKGVDGGGNIKANDTTTEKLTVNGALYGNIEELLKNRTYIKDENGYVEVGTNVNFTSKVFSSPPPLLSKFLGEYMEGKKIPK